jgi:hypothetical protein
MTKERSTNQKCSQISVGKLTVLLSDWVLNQLTNDFGLDFDVRICNSFVEKKQTVTKTSFYVQLKSTTEPCVPEPYHDLDIDDINLFANQGIPVVLIKYYEKCDQFHWVIIQPYVWDILDKEDPGWSNKSTKRIKIPHKLENLKELENQVLTAQKRIARHQVSDLGIGEAIHPTELEKFRNRQVEELKAISLDLASQKTKSGEFDRAKQLFEEVATSPDDDSYKLNAILNLVFQSDSSKIEDHPKILSLIRQGIELADKISAQNYLLLLKIMKYRVQLVRIVSQLSRVLYAKKYDDRDGEGTFSFFYQLNAQALDSIHKSVIKSMGESISELIKGHYRSELILALAIAIESITHQIQTLGFIDPEKMQAEERNRAPFIQSFIDLLKTEPDKDRLQNGYFDLFLYFYWSGNAKLAKEYLEKAKHIAVDTNCKGYVEKCNELLIMIDEHPNPLEIPDQKESVEDMLISEGKDATRKHLEIMGIDFKNPDKLTKETILPALDEMDPTEYLRYCKHFRISYISTSPLGQSIALPSLGMKAIWCQFGGGRIGFSLKNMIPHFQSTICEKCKNRVERSKKWVCKIKEFEELNKDPQFQEYIDKMVKAMDRE